MFVLTIRTDKPESEISLYSEGEKIDYYSWEAHRLLAETLNIKIRELLVRNSKDINDLNGLVVFTGPGSFTGLRIGLSVANAISFAASVPIIGKNGEKWEEMGIALLMGGANDRIILPNYGAEANITLPKK